MTACKQIDGLQKVKNGFAADKESIVQKYSLSDKANKSPIVATEWQDAYPKFSLTVTARGCDLHNSTKLSTNDGGIRNQVSWLESFDKQNKKERGIGVKNVRVTICANAQNMSTDTFTKGWVPKQDEDISENKSVAYSVEYMDGTSTALSAFWSTLFARLLPALYRALSREFHALPKKTSRTIQIRHRTR